MNSTELRDTFRADVVDTIKPYLWTDAEVYGYADEAQMMFCRLAGGLPDVTTEAVCSIPVVAGEQFANLHPSILMIRQVTLASTGREIALRNLYDSRSAGDDYGMVIQASNDTKPGPVRAMVIGEEYNKCRWVSVPEVNDTVHITVFRLPIRAITGPDQNLEIRREHHRTLLHWMKFLAYSKPDADTFDKTRGAENEAAFYRHCAEAKAEWERYHHKPRSIKYGGIGGVGDYGPTSIRRVW